MKVANANRLPCGGTPYEDVAKKLKAHMGHVMGCLKSYRSEGWCPPSLANDLADLFAAANPKFNKAKFLADCGL